MTTEEKLIHLVSGLLASGHYTHEDEIGNPYVKYGKAIERAITDAEGMLPSIIDTAADFDHAEAELQREIAEEKGS